MTTLVWAVVCIVLAAAGAGLGYWFGNRHRAGESAKREAVQAELDDYRKRVSEHFGETATRFHDLGRQYRELYEHMAAGSQDLCSVDDASGKLPFAPSDRPAIAGGGSTPAPKDRWKGNTSPRTPTNQCTRNTSLRAPTNQCTRNMSLRTPINLCRRNRNSRTRKSRHSRTTSARLPKTRRRRRKR